MSRTAMFFHLARRVVKGSPDELRAAGWAFLYFFALLAGYYVLRPIRDEMALQVGTDALHTLFSLVFVAMLGLVPLFGWLTRRFSRAALLPWLYTFFALNLLGFFAVLRGTGHEAPLLARAFFVWVSVFNLFAVSVFWSFMAELFDTAQAERLYGFIAAGGTAGALTGPVITASLVTRIGQGRLLLVSAGLLTVVAFAVRGVVRCARAWPSEQRPRLSATRIEGSVWSGLIDVLRSPYLLGICLFLFCYALLSTFLYFQQTELVAARYTDGRERTQLFAQADLLVNVATLCLQLFAFNRLTRRFGTRLTLAAMPVVSLVGFTLLAGLPSLTMLIAVGMIRRAGEFAISKPARETLFNVLPDAQKYRAKNVIDTLVHRGGDSASAWIIAGLRKLGVSASSMLWLPVSVSVVWVLAALWLARSAAAKRALSQATTDP